MKKFNDVFVVDDDKVYHFILKNLLKKNKIEVNPLFFENGQDAIDGLKENAAVESNLPTLVLLDINMPVMDGWQFLEEFKKIKGTLNKETIIYMISSSNNPIDLNRLKDFSQEIKEYMLKPVCLEDICKIFLN